MSHYITILVLLLFILIEIVKRHDLLFNYFFQHAFI